MHKYKSILLATNAHKYNINTHSSIKQLGMQVTRNRAIDVTPKKQKKSGKGLRIDAVQQRDYVY